MDKCKRYNDIHEMHVEYIIFFLISKIEELVTIMCFIQKNSIK